MPIDSVLHFGASTRHYIIRERPQTISSTSGGVMAGEGDKAGEEMEGGLLGLPETETELDVGGAFNTNGVTLINWNDYERRS